ncbi:hypothetical protein DFJ73DRAFT_797427 [Zopfochytrium polystomum]|nr:hypothetical protein DFJ73DRAFT_797427 [Zopfochytrium polystomum]
MSYGFDEYEWGFAGKWRSRGAPTGTTQAAALPPSSLTTTVAPATGTAAPSATAPPPQPPAPTAPGAPAAPQHAPAAALQHLQSQPQPQPKKKPATYLPLRPEAAMPDLDPILPVPTGPQSLRCSLLLRRRCSRRRHPPVPANLPLRLPLRPCHPPQHHRPRTTTSPLIIPRPAASVQPQQLGVRFNDTVEAWSLDSVAESVASSLATTSTAASSSSAGASASQQPAAMAATAPQRHQQQQQQQQHHPGPVRQHQEQPPPPLQLAKGDRIVVLHGFAARSAKEMSVRKGEVLNVQKASGTWVYAVRTVPVAQGQTASMGAGGSGGAGETEKKEAGWVPVAFVGREGG